VTTTALGRRTFLRTALAGAAVLGARPGHAEEVVTLGVVLPSPSPVAKAITEGAGLGLDDANALATQFGKRLRLVSETAPDGAAAAAAGRALAGAGAIALLGGAGDSAPALRDATAATGTVVFNVAMIDEALRQEGCARHVFHLAPSVTMLMDTLGSVLAGRRLGRWAVAGDGRARAQELEAAARRTAARHGATVVTGEASDVTLLALEGPALREALGAARTAGRAVAGVGGDVPMSLGPHEAIGYWAVGWHHELQRFSARELNSKFRRRFAGPLSEASWASWAAVKLVGEAVVRASAASPAALVAFLQSAQPFDGHKGTALVFRAWDHQLRQPLYVVGPRKREDVSERRGPFELVGETAEATLDGLGTSAAESRCRQGAR
jgi:ABC-type branched-subunit amino acid transport system substrate-binding protein